MKMNIKKKQYKVIRLSVVRPWFLIVFHWPLVRNLLSNHGEPLFVFCHIPDPRLCAWNLPIVNRHDRRKTWFGEEILDICTRPRKLKSSSLLWQSLSWGKGSLALGPGCFMPIAFHGFQDKVRGFLSTGGRLMIAKRVSSSCYRSDVGVKMRLEVGAVSKS